MADQTPLIDSDDYSSRGHRICGCCCDSKRGTIIINIINVIGAILYMGIVAAEYNNPNLESNTMDQATIDNIHKYYIPYMVVYGVSIVTYLGVLYGASTYNIKLVLVGVIWSNVELIFQFVVAARVAKNAFYLLTPVIWLAVWVYPQVVFIYEVQNGIMSPQTYHRERHSCCCV